jgi:osmotically-inducible protein OsmY
VKQWFRTSLVATALAIAPVSFAAAQSSDKAVDMNRDARANGPTADNQKNNKTDIKTTADIRRSIVRDKSLSTNAHNVKIIARNGAVTLRGRVNSEDERKSVVAKAEEVAGHGNVTDQLKIAPGKMKDQQPDK